LLDDPRHRVELFFISYLATLMRPRKATEKSKKDEENSFSFRSVTRTRENVDNQFVPKAAATADHPEAREISIGLPSIDFESDAARRANNLESLPRDSLRPAVVQE
jgi:hypothetical protein